MTIAPFVLGVLCCLAAEAILFIITASIGSVVEKAKRKPFDTLLELAKMVEKENDNERTGE